MSKSIDIIISTVLKKTGIDAARSALRNFAATAGRNLMNIKAGFDMISSAVRTFGAAMSRGMAFEAMTTRFKALTGSMELAKQHMADLQELGRTPPFSLDEFAAASQAMMKMTGGMAGFKKEMEIVGDMAAATGNDIAAVGRAFGLAYQVIRDGQSFGRAGQQLFMMGILTKQQVAYFDELSKSGKSNAEVWAELSEVFNRYKGAMDETQQTTKGVVDAIKGEAEVALTDFSAAITDAAKPAIEGFLAQLKTWNEDGTIEDWADRSSRAMSSVIETISETKDALTALGSGVQWLYEKLGLSDIWHGLNSIVQGVGAGVGALAGGGEFSKAYNEAATEEIAKGYYGGKAVRAGLFGKDQADKARSLVEGETDEERRERIAAEKAAKKKAEAAKAEAEAEKRKQEDLARAQEEIDKRIAAKKAEEEQKAAEKAEAARLKAVEAERKAREKMEADLHRQRVNDARAEIKATEATATNAETIRNEAQTAFDKAFAMYRDKDLAAQTIAEERDYAADYKRFGRDVRRYGGKWRIDELAALMAAGDTQGQAAKLEEWRKSSRFTPEVESLVRAAAAEQTRTTAEDELRKINATLSDQSAMLENLLTMKGE